ncbi:MAG: hypothetical protein NTX75_09515 [Proteobacteria bacterium]|nr:hypothetical protein [Pseudomonadota bacterium]
MTHDRSDIGKSTLAYVIRDELDQCLDDICNQYGLTEDIRLKNMVKCYLCGSIGSRITFINMVREKIDAKGMSKEAEHKIYIRRHSLNAFIRRFYEQHGLIIKESGIVGENVGTILKLFAYFAIILYGKVFYRGVFTNIKESKPAVWVGYVNSNFLDFCFWQDGVDRDKIEIVHFLFGSGTTKNTIQTMEERGNKWVYAHFLPVLQMSGISLNQIVGTMKRLFKDINDYPLILAYLFFLNHFYYLIYRIVFKKFQVRVLIQHHDTSWLQDMWARAMEDAGGILLNFHWSHSPTIARPTHLFPFHAFFVWGDALYSVIQEGGHTCKYILPSGLWIVGDDNDAGIKSFPREVDFIITLFDSAAAYNIHQTEETLSLLYLRILELLEKQPSWGLIVKSKDWGVDGLENLPAGNLIVQKIKHLMASDRARVLPSSTSPVTAASQADLSVCYGLNSAGIIAAVHGYKTIHWDCAGWHNHPFYKDREQKFIFRNLDEVEAAIIRASEGDAAIGDFSRWRKLYNYFDDFNASSRVGSFIEDFIDEISSHHNVDAALQAAVDKYMKENQVSDCFYRVDSCKM